MAHRRTMLVAATVLLAMTLLVGQPAKTPAAPSKQETLVSAVERIVKTAPISIGERKYLLKVIGFPKRKVELNVNDCGVPDAPERQRCQVDWSFIESECIKIFKELKSAATLTKDRQHVILIEFVGHASDDGPINANLDYSQKRADHVRTRIIDSMRNNKEVALADWLSKNSSVQFVSSSQPVKRGTSPDPVASRRVEVFVVLR